MPHDVQRSRRWTDDPAPRYWWHRLPGMDYVPPVYASLSDDEWPIIAEWYSKTDRAGQIGEAAVPLMSLLHGLVMGNRAARIVQLGTHAGYSALLLGFMLRQMNAARGLFTLDIDREFCGVARGWIERANLLEFVEVAEGNSLDSGSAGRAREYLGGAPELIILDSSHEYRATLDELDLWYAELATGGLLVVHDVSRFAQGFDVTGSGGVRRAFDEWRVANRGAETFLLNGESRSMDLPRPFYKDACGAGLIHKPGA
ncbi:MAG TPA: class I SAM-dependent methyltransferase [Chthoniobacterales bacterium]|nr:class I SAM-dependent methyltransferase [Chthoniobacterales bacterium]